MSRIEQIEVVPVRAPVHDGAIEDPAYEAAIVRVRTDDGLEGWGEALGSPFAVKAFIETPAETQDAWVWGRGPREMLIGRELEDPREIWAEFGEATLWSGRAGLGHIALAGLDMALWDVWGKAIERPVWQILGPQRADAPMAYITIYDAPGYGDFTVDSANARIEKARDQGFTAVKLEAPLSTTLTDDAVIDFARTTRERQGDGLTMMLDLCYRWPSAEHAIRYASRLEEYALTFIEAPLHSDDLLGYARLTEAIETPVAAAEILTSYAEFSNLMEIGGVDYVQPATARVGITESDRLARSAALQDRAVVPYGAVATTLATAANLHLAWANENVRMVEYLPASVYDDLGVVTELRTELAGPEPTPVDGRFPKPELPGLGVEVDREALSRYSIGRAGED